MQNGVRDVADVDVIALEILFEDYEVSVRHRGINEMINQKIQAHPRRGAKYRRQTQRNHVRLLQ